MQGVSCHVAQSKIWLHKFNEVTFYGSFILASLPLFILVHTFQIASLLHCLLAKFICEIGSMNYSIISVCVFRMIVWTAVLLLIFACLFYFIFQWNDTTDQKANKFDEEWFCEFLLIWTFFSTNNCDFLLLTEGRWGSVLFYLISGCYL